MIARRIALSALAVISLSSCQTTGGAMEALGTPKSAVQQRAEQTRTVEAVDDKIVIQTIVATLQDFGFSIKESNVAAGLVSGIKSQQGGIFYGQQADVRVTVTASQVTDGKSTLRVNFQKVIPGADPRYYRSEAIADPNLYQKFFSSVEQSLFLRRNEK